MSSETLAPAAVPRIPRPDFPTWLPPMLVKELRQGLRTKGFVGAFVVFQVLMAVLLIGTVGGSSLGNATARAMMAQTVNQIFWIVLAVQLLVVTPARALGSLQSETESRTIDLLLLTRLNAWRVVTGKWISLLAQAGLLFVAMLPYGMVRYFGGTTDLVTDALGCCALFGGCCVLTAAGLWASGMPRILRAVLPVVLGLGFISIANLGRGPFGGLAFFSGSFAWILWYFNGAVVTVFFLVTAVRRIAPIAETHVLLSRGLPLLTLLPVPIWAWMAQPTVAAAQFLFALDFLAIVCAIELASLSRPVMAHWAVWADRGLFGRCVGRLVMPGWPSAMLYLLLTGLLASLAAFSPRMISNGDTGGVIGLLGLAMAGLLAPVLVLSFAERVASRSPGGFYLLTVVALSAFGIIAAGLLRTLSAGESVILPIAQVLPISSFWVTLIWQRPASDLTLFMQGVLAVAVLGVALLQSRHYWREFALFEVTRRMRKS